MCHNGWDYADANVVCRSLGYIGALDFTIRWAKVNVKRSIIYMILSLSGVTLGRPPPGLSSVTWTVEVTR